MGCLAPHSVVCSDGRICPADTRCDVDRHVCLGLGVDQQADACSGRGEGQDCTLAGAPGKCHDRRCEPFTCGDGVRTDPEACDGTDLGGMTCAALGYYGQTTGLGCTQSCMFEFTGCVGICGDAMTNGAEQCDGAPPAGKACVDLGYDRGILGCSSTCGPVLDACGEIGWKSARSQEQMTFLDVWGDGPDDLFAVGLHGTIVRGNGTSWSPMTSGMTSDFYAVWGSGPNDVYAVGSRDSHSDAAVAHWDGAVWAPVPLDTGATMLGVWGSGPGDVFVVGGTGQTGAIAHWNGVSWSLMPSDTIGSYGAVWGTGPRDVFVVADGGMIHWDGQSWSHMETPVNDLVDVWGTGSKNVYAVGSGGGIAHWDGARWSLTMTKPGLSRLGGSGPNDVYAVGSPSTFHWDGRYWSETSPVAAGASGVFGDMAGLWASAPDEVVVAGKGLQHSNGDTWLTTSTGVSPRALWAASADDLFVFQNAMFLFIYSRTTGVETSKWSLMDMVVPTTYDFDAWGSGPNDVFAIVGGFLHHWDGTSWSTPPVVLREVGWQGVWGSGPNDVFAVGSPPGVLGYCTGGSEGLAQHWDGTSWSKPVTVSNNCLKAVWASGPNDAFAVGNAGTVVHWDGSQWQTMASGTTAALASVWGSGPGDVYAVGEAGTILHFNGKSWMSMPSGTTGPLARVRGSGRGDVFVSGGSTLLHLRSQVWEAISLPASFSAALEASAGDRPLWVTPSRVFLSDGSSQILELDRHNVTCAGPEKACADGWDNDCDGLADSADPDCAGKVQEQCANLVDDDGNGLGDCADPACATFPPCKKR